MVIRRTLWIASHPDWDGIRLYSHSGVRDMSDSANEEQEGYVYIMYNPDFKSESYKIGKSLDPPQRQKQLHTSTATPFEIVVLLKSNNYAYIEREIHERYDEYRVDPNTKREFFYLSAEQICEIMADYVDILVYPSLGKSHKDSNSMEKFKATEESAWKIVENLFKRTPVITREYLHRQMKMGGVHRADIPMFLKQWDVEDKIHYDFFEDSYRMQPRMDCSAEKMNALLGRRLYESRK